MCSGDATAKGGGSAEEGLFRSDVACSGPCADAVEGDTVATTEDDAGHMGWARALLQTRYRAWLDARLGYWPPHRQRACPPVWLHSQARAWLGPWPRVHELIQKGKCHPGLISMQHIILSVSYSAHDHSNWYCVCHFVQKGDTFRICWHFVMSMMD